MEGVPIFIDVEGMPDRDFYYLIGLRFESQGGLAEHAFWADRPEDERGMWENCLSILKSVESVQLVHYGAYEKRFLRTMKKRYISEPHEEELVDRLITWVWLFCAQRNQIIFNAILLCKRCQQSNFVEI